jgi:hypothetical protein
VDPDSHHSKGSIPDEDPLDEAVTDPNILAEVTLSKRPSAYFTITNFQLLTIYTTRIQMDVVESCPGVQLAVLPSYDPAISL